MGRAISGIDHILVGVRDLEAARRQWARLGFTPTPRGRHQGWGTANYCLMLETGYVELLGIVDPALFTNNLDRFLEAREGLLGVALASRDPAATEAAWRTAGLGSARRAELGRLLEDEESEVALRFENVMVEAEDVAGLRLFACHHLTPEHLRRPAWLDHANTARSFRAVTILVDEPEAVAERLAAVLGSGAITSTDAIWTAHAGRQPLVLARPGDAVAMHPAFNFPESAPSPLPMVMEIAVADPDQAAAHLDAAGVSYRRGRDGTLAVPPEETAGVMLELTPG